MDGKHKDYLSELQKNRQKELLSYFMAYSVMTIFNMILVYFLRGSIRSDQTLSQLLVSLLIPIGFALGIYITYRKTKGHKAFDRVVFINVLLFSVLSLFFGTNVLLSLTSYMPVFLFLVFSTMNRKYFLIYLLVNVIIVALGYVIYGLYTYEVNVVNYVTIVASLVMVSFIAVRLIYLYKNYLENITKDYHTLNDKNVELRALNEEYYATQEELFEQYDEVSQLNESNHKLAYFDSLTGLPNRNNFLRAVEDKIQKKSLKGYIFFADISRFKDINSVYGYVVGDQVLKIVAKRLKDMPFQVETVARMSGDMFAAIIEEDTSEQALRQAFDLVSAHMDIEHFTIVLSMNFGVLKLSDDSLIQSKVFQSVDAALNKAKEQRHEHVYFFNLALMDEIEKRVTMSNALEKAIRDHTITTVYQPVVSSQTGHTVAYETLARWTDPVLGHISPEFFIKHAEESGMIVPLGELILRQACHFILDLAEANKSVLVTVNLSTIQLLQDHVVTKLLEIIEASGVSYEQIGFEVTETDLIRDFEVASMRLKRLKDKGIKIYLDDFGTGYSSLNYLSMLPIDVLKIDRGFITDIHKSQKKQTMLDIIIQLAKDYQLTMVAEGVETEDEYIYLREKGIQTIQGYYFSRPLPPGKFLDKY